MDHPDNQRLWKFYLADLTIRKLSKHTIANYEQTLNSLDAFLGKSYLDATKLDLMAYIAEQAESYAARTVKLRHVGIRVFYNWALNEDLLAVSPIAGVPEPKVDDVPPAVVSEKDLKALLKDCSGKNFLDKRDNALFRLMLEPGGARRAEIIGLTLEDIDLDNGLVRLFGKGSKTRYVPYGAKTSQALMRYTVVRAKHKYADEPGLWLGRYGVLTNHSLRMILRRRCKGAGIDYIYPHQLRHTSADAAMRAGISDLDMMTLFGWSSSRMLEVYARSNRSARAIASARKFSVGDRY